MKIFALILCLNIMITAELLSSIGTKSEANRISIQISNIEQNLKNISEYNKHIATNISDDSKYYYFNFAISKADQFIIDYDIFNYKLVDSDDLAESSKDEHISTVYIGNRRGIDIYQIRFNPYRYSDGLMQIADSVSIRINFGSKYDVSSKRIPDRIRSFYSDIININHIPFIENHNGKKNENVIQSNDFWYDNSIDYVRVSTTVDGIATIAAQSLFEYAPQWQGKSADGLHLLKNGVSYPIFIESSSGNLDLNANIYFLGTRASGDTTWFENYTDESVYYLYYDANKSPNRLNLLSEPSNGTELGSVNINMHIEKDLEYFLGTVNIFPRTDYLEGWYMAIISKIGNNRYSKNLNFLPVVGENLNIKTKYATLNTAVRDEHTIKIGGTDPRENYHINFLLNNDTAKTVSLNSWSNDYASAVLDGSRLYAGANNITVVNHKIDQSNGLLGIDYFKIIGKAKPFPINGAVQFGISSLDSDSKLAIPGFESSLIFGIDTISNSIIKKYGTESYRFAVSAGNNEQEAIVMVINDTILRYEQKGFAIAYKKPNTSAVFRYFPNNSGMELIANELNALPNGTLIVAAGNSSNSLHNSIVNLFTLLGAKSINMASDGIGWVFATVKGNAKIFEKFESNHIATIDGYIEQSGANSYSLDLFLHSAKDYSFIFNSSGSIENAKLRKVNQTNLTATDIHADMIIIYHEKFYEPTKALSEYRNTKGITTYMANVEDIYKEFGYGKKTPHSIKAFLKYAYQNFIPAPQYLLIVGDASWDGRKVLKGSISENFVPSYGQPVSDYWYGLLEGDDFEPEMIVGRIPAHQVAQVYNYLEKMIDFENTPTAPWMKDFLYLSGGLTESERNTFAGFRYYLFEQVSYSPLCADTVAIHKRSVNAGSEEESSMILNQINEGKVWTNFFGHSSSQVFDLDGWQVEYLNNKGKYGFLSTLSCNTGAFAEPLDLHGRNEQYILAKDRGFVAAFGTTGVGFVFGATPMLSYMTQAIADSSIALRRAGDILYFAKAFLSTNNEIYLVTKEIFQMQGDPTLKIRIGIEPDLFFSDNHINLKSKIDDKEFVTDSEDYANISGLIFNNGYSIDGDFIVEIIRTYKNHSDTLTESFSSICNAIDFNFDLPILNMPGEHSFVMNIIPLGFEDANIEDNTISKTFYVYNNGLMPVEPLSYWNINANNPHFRFINPIFDKYDFSYSFKVFEFVDGDTLLVHSSSNAEIFKSFTHIDWLPDIKLNDNRSYLVEAILFNITKNTESYPTSVPFNTYFSSIEQTYESFVSYSELKSFETVGLSISKEEPSIQINNATKSIEILSVNGRPDESLKSWGRLTVDNDVYFDSEYFRGFNVLVMPKAPAESKGRFRTFDTWKKLEDTEDLIRLLRDTVTADDYVIIATCNQSFRAFEEFFPDEHFATLDSLKAILKSYGSSVADSLRSSMSFAFIGYRNAPPHDVFESINEFDTASVSANLQFYGIHGTAKSKIIGPVAEWNSITINSDFDVAHSNVSAKAKFIDRNNRDTIVDLVDLGISDISFVDPIEYPYLQLLIDLQRTNFFANAEFDKVSVQYTPLPEIAIDRPSSFFESDKINRGDTANINVKIINISMRADANDYVLSHKKTSSSGIAIENESLLPLIPRNTSIIYNEKFGSEPFHNKVFSLISVAGKKSELYDFNNVATIELSLIEDTTKPTAVVKFDGKLVQNGDYISVEPEIIIEMYDNSKLPVLNQSGIHVRLNGMMLSANNTNLYNFESFEFGSSLKARLTLHPDSLIETDNSIFIYLNDASSNRDTIRMVLHVSRNGIISSHKVAPNPSYEQTEFIYEIKTPFIEGDAEIQIFNVNGNKIRTLNNPVSIGRNTIQWDNRDMYGNMAAPGLYFYMIRIRDTIFFETVNGKIIIVK